MKTSFRKIIRQEDISLVKSICLSTGFFRMDEVEVATELIEEALVKGQEQSGYHFILMEHEDATCGFACYGPTPCTEGTFDLYWIVVDNNFRGKGFGLQLIQQTENALRNQNARKLYIETSSTDKYLPTRNFYEKAGYTEEARLKDFYLEGDDKVIYAKRV